MTEATTMLTRIFALGAIAGSVAAIMLVVWLFLPNLPAAGFIRRYAIPLAWFTAFISMAGSLYYSEIAHLEPCPLCWYQRIAMYPLVVLLAIMSLRKNFEGFASAMVLISVGFVIASYHAFLQVGALPPIPCSAIESAVSCSTRYVSEFGFVTIPFMTASGFSLIGTLLLAARRAARLHSESAHS